MALDAKIAKSNAVPDYSMFATKRIDVEIGTEHYDDNIWEKYDLNLDLSPIIAETPTVKIYKILSKTDSQQSFALKYYPYGAKESDEHEMHCNARVYRTKERWKLAKKYGLLPDAEIYDNILRNELFLVQKLWMCDTNRYMEQHTKTKSANLRSKGWGISDRNMFKNNTNNSIALLLQDICPRLRVLHKAGYAHCDIKAANICMDWNTKTHQPLKFGLIDFDLLHKQGRSIGLAAFGTPSHFPPEMIVKDKESVIVTDKFDVYALGITIIELMNGKHPYFYDLYKKYQADQIKDGAFYGFLTSRYIFNMVQANEELNKHENHFLKHLIYHMILFNSEKRYNIHQVMNHRWYKKHCSPESDDINALESRFEVEEKTNTPPKPPQKVHLSEAQIQAEKAELYERVRRSLEYNKLLAEKLARIEAGIKQ